MMNETHGSHEDHGSHGEKPYTIIVNSRPHEWHEKEISFDQVVRLAYPNPGPDQAFTVSYRNAEGPKKSGDLVEGQKVHVKDGTVFNVTSTNKS